MFLLADNVLYGSGRNDVGQIGDGTTTARDRPVIVFTNVADVSAGPDHTVFLQLDGSAWATGRNDVGQLGDRTRTARKFPKNVISNVRAVAAGIMHTVFLKFDGSVWATGQNQMGQLGDGTRSQKLRPTRMVGVEGIKFIGLGAGSAHNIILRDTGEVYACGSNDYGQFGDGSRISSKVPVATGFTGVTAVVASTYYSIFTRTDGTSWAAGLYEGGELAPKLTLNQVQQVVVPWETSSPYYPLVDRATIGAQ